MSQETNTTDFTRRLLKRLFDCQFKEYSGNYDADRFGPRPATDRKELRRRKLREFASRFGFVERIALNKVNWDAWNQWAPLFPELEWLYEKLEDEHSRKTLVDVIVYRMMGPRAICLERNNREFWNLRKQVNALANDDLIINAQFSDWSLPQFDLESMDYPVKLHSRAVSIVAQFFLEQYADPTGTVRVREGDTVIDAGACWGDTALYFAHLAGNAGTVFSFELSPENLSVFRQNLALNPKLADRVEIIEKALWDRDDETLEMRLFGPATSIARADQPGETSEIETITIDTLVDRKSLEKVDFIKMDIEGAETAALRGAEKTLKRFRPRLAISLYHSPSDFTEIPRYLESIGAGYRFSIDHFTIHAEETVLFAIAE